MLKRRGKATETNPGWLYYTRPYTAAAYILPTSFIYQEKYSPKNSVEKKILHPPAQERTIYTESKELVLDTIGSNFLNNCSRHMDLLSFYRIYIWNARLV
jgi:hypothetical protein